MGKTTLTQMLPDAVYLNCDLPSTRQALEDPELFLENQAPGSVLAFDEVHHLDDPSGLLKIAADGYPSLKILATGSSTLAATRKFRDSLTGRKQAVHLCPVLWEECAEPFGVRDLANQFAQVRAVIDAHDGPVVVSGDFNTWRSQRTIVLQEMLSALGLAPLEFDIDHRKRFFGWALDHIYVRGLQSEHATTMSSRASDHNPMSVRLRLTEDEPRVRAAR